MSVREAEAIVKFKQRFNYFVNEYTSQSQNPCIVTREKATCILKVLKNDPSVHDDPQLIFYIKQKQFQLRDFPQFKLRNVLCVPANNHRKNSSKASQGMFEKYHRVALKDEFFDIIYEIHTQEGSRRHFGGRSTIQEINRHHAYIPQAVILNFIKMCPLCSQSFEYKNLLSAGDLSQPSDENNGNHFPKEDSFEDIKPNVQFLEKVLNHNHFASCQDKNLLSTFSSNSSQPYGTPLRYSPTPPPSATQWSNSVYWEENINNPDIEANHFMAVGKVSIIDIQELLNLSYPPKHYTYLVHYMDLWSKYSILWPLRWKDIDELASGIAKNVFAYFGSPKQIIYDTNFEESHRLEESLQKWSKQLKVTIGLQEPLAKTGHVHWKIVEKLKELLVESWEVNLSKLQYISNTKLVTTHGQISPYKAVTGNDPFTETFSELADKYSAYPDQQQDFMYTDTHNNLLSENNLNTVSEVANPSTYSEFDPVISHVFHVDDSNSPGVSSGASCQKMGPTPAACMENILHSTNVTKQFGNLFRDQKKHAHNSVSSVGQFSSPGSQVTISNVHSQEMPAIDVSNNNNHNNLIYIEEDDDTAVDRKNIPLIEDFVSNVLPSGAQNLAVDHCAENKDFKNVALVENFNPIVEPVNSKNFIAQNEKNNGAKNVLLLDFSLSEQLPSSAAVENKMSVPELDKLPRLAQSFSFPSSLKNQEECGNLPNPTDLETSLATSLADVGLPNLTKSAQNVIDKYRLRAKILNSAQMKATRCGVLKGKPNFSKAKVTHQNQLPQQRQQSSGILSTLPRIQPKQRLHYHITSVTPDYSDHSVGPFLHRLKSQSRPDSVLDLQEKRKYWRQMKQRARARLSQTERDLINKRQGQKCAERKGSFVT